MSRLLFVLASLGVFVTATPEIPPELYSPLISQKLLSVSQSLTNPPTYPQWTQLPPYGVEVGQWQYFPLDTWTSGFLPASLLLLAERSQACPGGQLVATSDAATSVSDAHTWSAPLIGLETQNSFGHDVGCGTVPRTAPLRRSTY